MEIKIQRKQYVLSICIGRETSWFAQVFWLSIQKEWYSLSTRECVYAQHVFGFWRTGVDKN